MLITPVSTSIVHSKGAVIDFIDTNISTLEDGSVLVVTSKVISILQGDVITSPIDKTSLIQQESEWYLPAENNSFGTMLTITGHKLAAAAGIDASNTSADYVLLPSRVQQAANDILLHLRNKFKVSNIGVIITDSRSAPLSLGTHGIAIAYSGITPLKDYIGKKDLYNKTMRCSRLNVVNGIAAAAVTVMGEGAESTPLALVKGLDMAIFTQNIPSFQELKEQYYEVDNDLYSEFLKAAKWYKGGGGYLARQ